MRYFLRLSYNGAPYHGWQVQPNAVSVQSTIEEALSMVLRESISIVGAGRTDTGVNARMMFAHFDYTGAISDKCKLINSLNRLVGKNIAIYDIIDVSDDAHARFDATSRTYKYFVTHEKSPFHYPFSWYCPQSLDYDKMNEACEVLKRHIDFTSFSKLHTDVKTNNCRIDYAHWKQEGEMMVFTITADRFLRNMVRAVVGTLVEVGRGKISVEEFEQIILKKDRCSAGTSMPPQALFLWNVEYPYL
ncbi:MAG: tRNA pseudouridine(38-40) synthase TruA [Bacteroidales bacterium]|nr:tRNA pseudouridine(38-40) synthase TruA [Bacteroidales bacterium]